MRVSGSLGVGLRPHKLHGASVQLCANQDSGLTFFHCLIGAHVSGHPIRTAAYQKRWFQCSENA